MDKERLLNPVIERNAGSRMAYKAEDTSSTIPLNTPSLEGYDFYNGLNDDLQPNQKREVEGIIDWFSDSWKAFANTKDTSEADSIRADLVTNTNEAINSLEYRLNYVKLAKEVDRLQKEYAANPNEETAEKYRIAADRLYELEPQYTEYVNKYGDKPTGSYDDEINRLDTNLKWYYEHRDSQLKEIEELQNNVKERGVPSKQYQDIANDTDFSFTSLDSWLYKMPETLGSSFVSAQQMAESYATALATQYASKQAFKYAAFNGGPQAALAAEVASWITSAIGAGIITYNTYRQRDTESKMEVYQAYKSKVMDDMNKMNIDMYSQIAEQFEQLTGRSSDGMSSEDMLDYILSTRTDSSTEFGKILAQSKEVNKEGLDALYKQNMALGLSDIVQTSLTVLPVGKVLNKTLAPITGAVTKPIAKANKALTNYIDYSVSKPAKFMRGGKKFLKATPTGRIINKLGGGTVRVGTVAALEGQEEGVQYYLSKKFAEGEYKGDYSGFTGVLKGALDNVEANWEVGKAQLGIFGDPSLMNDEEFFQNITAGRMMGALFGGVGNTITTAKELNREIIANNKVRKAVIDQITSKDNMYKARIYVDKKLKGKEKEVLDAIDNLKYNLPEGVTAEDIDAEKARAKRIMSIANSPHMEKLMKSISRYGSEDHAILAGLIANTQDRITESTKSLSEAESKLATLYNSDENLKSYLDLIPKEKQETYKLLNDLLLSKHAIEQIKTDLNSSINSSEEGITLSDKAKEAQKKFSTYLDNKLKALNTVIENTAKANGININEDNDLALLNSATLEAGLTQAVNKEVSQYNLNTDIVEQRKLNGTAVPSKRKKNNAKQYDESQQYIINRIDEYRKAARENGQITAQDEITFSNSENDIQVVDEVEHNHTNEIVSDNSTEQKEYVPDTEEKPVIVDTENTNRKAEDLMAEVREKFGLNEFEEKRVSLRPDEPSISTQQPTTEPTKQDTTQNQNNQTNQQDTAKPNKVEADTKNNARQSGDSSTDSSSFWDSLNDTSVDDETDISTENTTNVSSTDDNVQDNVKEEKKAYGADNKIVTKEEYEDLRRRLRDKLNQLNSGLDPEGLLLGIRMTMYHLEAGTRRFAEYANEMINDLGEAVKPYLKAFYEGARRMPEAAPYVKDMDSTSYVDSFNVNTSTINDHIDDVNNYEDNNITTQDQLKESTKSLNNIPTSVVPTEDEIANNDIPQDLVEIGTKVESLGDSTTDEINTILQINPDDTQNIIEDAGTGNGDRISHTLFVNPTSKKPMKPGYKTGKEFIEFISDPYALDDAETEIIVERYGKSNYDERHPETWDDAAIYIAITTRNGNKYIAALKTPQSIANDTRLKPRDGEIERLRTFRNKIVEKYINLKKNQKLVATAIRRTNGFFNNRKEKGKVVNRSLFDIKGLGLPDNIYAIDTNEVTIGIGTGLRGMFKILDGTGNVLPGLGASGKIYIYPPAANTPSGKSNAITGKSNTAIKLNEMQFKDNRDIAEFIVELAVNLRAADEQYENTPFTVRQLLSFIVHFGNKTKVNDITNYGFLLPKQFYRNEENNGIVLGTNMYYDEDIRNNPEIREEVIKYIMDNQHFAFDKDWSFGYMNETAEGLRRWFIMNDVDVMNLGNSGIRIELADVGLVREGDKIVTDKAHPRGLSWLAWAIKNKYLTSDLDDNLFKDVFSYIEDVEVVEKPNEPTIEKKQIVNDKGNTIEKPATKKPSAFDDLNKLLGVPKLIIRGDYTVADIANELKVLKRIFGNIFVRNNVQVVNDVINVANAGTTAMGLTTRDSILLYEKAEQGTAFHEAFHRVSLLLLTPAQRNKIYTEKREKLDQPNLTNEEVEEILAEEYREYVLSDGRYENILKDTEKIKLDLFKRMFGLNKALSTTSKVNINKLFKAITNGKLALSSINQTSYDNFQRLFGEDGGAPFTFNGVQFSTIPNYAAFDSIVSALEAYTFLTNNIVTSSDLNKIDFNTVYTRLKASLNDDLTDSQYNVRKEVVDNFEKIFIPAIKAKLSALSIREIDKNINENVTEIDGGNIVGDSINAHIIDSMEVSKKNNALASVKIFMSTIPNTRINTEGQLELVTDPLTGLPTFVNFDITWNTMLRDLHNCETYEEIVSTVEALGKDSAFYRTLSNRLKTNKDVNLETQIYQTVKSHIHEFIHIGYEYENTSNGRKSKFRVGDSNLRRAKRIYPALWSSQFFGDNKLFKFFTNKAQEPIQSKVKDLVTRYNQIAEDLKRNISDIKVISNAKSRLVSVLNDAGIAIDDITLNDVLNNNKQYTNLNEGNALLSLLTKQGNNSLYYLFNTVINNIADNKATTVRAKFGLDKTLDNTKLFAQSPILRVFAESYAKLHPRPEETTVLGPNNAQLYEISQNCYLTDMVRWLNNDPNMLSNLSSVAYNTGKSGYGSLVLSALNEARSLGNKLNLHIKTLVNFTEEGKGDKGRDYVSITAIEDYITKMTLTRNDYLIAPTLADKKSYFVLQGIRLFHEGIKLRDNTLNFGSSTVNQFIEYAKAELYAIEHAMEIMNATDENGNKKLNPKDYPKNYFKGKHARGEGNGLRFRYFNGIYMNTTNGVEFIDFNQILDDSPNLQIGLEKVKEIFFNQSLDTQHYYVNDLLYRMVANELRFAESLGLIEFNNGKANIFSLKNKLLDQTEIDNLTEKYKGNSNPDIANNAHSIAVLDMIADYAINSAVSITEFEKLFSKDPAYHKDTDAKIKRLSAVSSTGDNLRTDWAIGHPLSGRTTFTVAALNDNMVKSSIADRLYDLFFENYKRDYIKEYLGVSEEKAIAYSKDENLAKAELDDNDYNTYLKAVSIAKDNADFNTKIYRTNDKGEGNINQADAAVYIRPQMYKDLVQMLGEWNDEVAEAFDLLTSEDTSWLSDSELYRKAIQASIKPLKMMYMGDTFLSDLGLDVPIFDKMAIFPLFKHFAYGDLADLYNKMNDPAKPIDMITFESAVKVGNRQQSDYYTDLNMESINSLDNMHIYNQEFKYLRRQLITDPHHTAEIHAGTQFIKASMSNLVTDRTYKEGTKYEITGEQLREDYFNAINELSNLGVKDILKLLGAKQNTDGDYVFSSYSNLAKMLREDAINSNMPSSIIEGLDVDENGDFIIPLSALSNSSWIESRFVSLINKYAIDITTPGGAFIQMSSFGLKSKKDFSNSAIYLNDGKPLNFRNDDGSMDCIISINLFKDIIPDEIKMTDFENQRKWLMSKGIIGNNAEPCTLGYRIPTQGTASISGLRIVDVLPSNIGDTIVLPDEFTGLTGSDFDIDKCYIARFNFNRDGQKIEFDRSKETKGKSAYKNNSPKALQNLLLQTFMTLITDEKTVGETRMSIDTATSTLKNDILKDIEKNKPSDPYVPYKYISPRFQLSKKLEYTTGKLGIGPFALNNANHVLTQLAGLEFNTSKLLEKYNISNLSGIYGKDGKRILDWLSAMINAFVDVAKDPYIIRLNVNQYTYNMCNFLLRTGIGDSTFYFLSQDILKDVANAVNNTNGRYGIDINQSKSNRRKEAIKKVLKQYETQARLKATDNNQVAMIDQILKQSRYNIDLKLLSGNMLTRKWLRKYTNIKPENKDFNYYYDQLRIFKLFDALSVYSDALSEMVQVSQIDTKKYGNNLTLLKSFGLRINRFLNNNSVFTSASLNRYWYNGFLDVKTNNSINLAKGLFQNLVIKGTHQFSKYHNLMLNLLGISNYSNTDMSNTVANLMESNIKINFIRQYAKDNNIDIYSLFYGENNIAKRLATLKNDILSGKYPELLDASGRINNELLNILQPVFKTSYDSFDKPNSIRIVTLSADSNIIDEAGIKYFEDLLTNDNTEISQFAKDLVVYSFIASGDNRTINSLNKFIPNSIKQDMGYVDYIRKTMDELNGDSFDYNLDDVFLNNWFNDSIVPTINTKDIVSVYSSETIKTSDGRNIPYALMFKGKPTDNYNTVNNHGDIIFTPYVKIEYGLPNNPETTVVYKYVGYELASNERFVPYYIAIDKKGVRDSQTSNLITEYGTDKSDLWYNILPNKIDISDGLSREDIIAKLNDILSKTDKRKINIIGTIKQFIESVSDEGINGLNFVTTWLPWNTNLSDTELLPDEQSVDNADIVHNSDELVANKSNEELANENEELTGNTDTPASTKKVEVFHGNWTRSNVAKQTDKVFLFGDNTDDRLNTHYIPAFTQAVIRGLDNAIGIDTKKNRGTSEGTKKKNPFNISDVDEQTRSQFAKDTGISIDYIEYPTDEDIEDYMFVEVVIVTSNGDRIQMAPKAGYRDKNSAVKNTNIEALIGLNYLLEKYLMEHKSDIDKFGASVLSESAKEVYGDKYDSSKDSFISDYLSYILSPVEGSSYFTDADFDTFKAQVDEAIQKALDSGKTIVIPENGIGTGKAQLKERAPKLFAYLQERLSDLQTGNTEELTNENNTESTEETQEQEVEDDVFTVPFRDELGYLMEGYFDTYENFIKASSRQLVIPNTPEIQAEEKPVNTVVIGDVLFNLSKLGINFKLNEQQVNALNTIASWLKQPSTRTSNPFYTLVGYAGTGKTTIMRVLLAYIEQAMKTRIDFIKLAAPTHKARMVLQNATGMNAMTIHQLLGLKADYNLDNYQTGDINFNAVSSKLPINQATFVIIDEVSMVNDNLINDISVIAKDKGIKVILVGDKAQLEPVNQGDVSIAFKNPNVVELDKVERQKDSNPLLVMLDYMRGIFADGSSNFVHQSKLNENGDGVLFADNTKDGIDILNVMVNMFSSDRFKTDLNYVKALAWTNGAVTNINNAIRKSMGYTDELNIGEPVSMYYTIEITDDMYLYNSMDYRITDSGDATEKIDLLGIELDGKYVSLLDGSANIEFKNIFVVTDRSKEVEIAKAISAKLEEIYALRNTISDKELKVKLAKFWSKLNSSFLTTFPIMYNGRTIKNKGIDYSYAITVHKSQGSTYNNVFVSEADINNNSNTRNRNQLKYVALSRASETAVVITNNDVVNDYNGEHYDISVLNDRKSNGTQNNTTNIPNSISLASDGLTTPGVVNGKTSAELLISDIDRIPSNEEIRNLRQIYNIDFNAGDRILAATERTDPAMFADDILNMLKNNRDKIKALYIITKHDGLPIKKLLQDPTPKFIHFSITGLGEKVEPGVMKPMDLLGKIEEYIKQGLNPNLITIRIDPLIPGLNIDGKTGEISNEVKKIIDKSLSMGITQFRTSMIDGYKSTVEDMASVGYNFSDYKDAYDSVNNDTWKYWSPKKSYIESAFLSLADYLTEKYIQMGIDPNSKTLHLCGEPIVFQNRPNKVNIERIGCVNTKIMMDILGLKDISAYDRSNPKDFANDRVEPLKQSTLNVKTESGMKQVTVYGKDRKNCYCAAFKNEHGQILSTKIDAAAIDQKKCMSMCAYCYMAMSKKQNNKPIRYYDEKGNLRDFNMTRTTMTNNDNIIDENRSDYDDSVMKHCKE